MNPRPQTAALVLLLALTALAARPVLNDPYAPGAAWPVMRGDLANSGRGQLGPWKQDPDAPAAPVRFHTGNGIFSTPVIDDQDRVFVGSADHFFYAFDPQTGRELWRYETGEIIDSAAALGPGMIYVPSGDAKIHALTPEGQKVWEFDTLNNRPKELFSVSTNYWWEGNVTLGPDGDLYAGSDDFFFYRVSPGGKLRWAFRAGFFIWAAAAFADGVVYVPSFDMKLYALDTLTGRLRWKTDLKNALVSSPAVGPDGTIYQGSMDGSLHALSPDGKLKWTFKTRGHVYASAAVAPDNTVYITSADGSLYALGPDGRERWTYYTGDAVRSSPALGPDPEGKEQYLVYFGGGEGSVYAIDPAGQRRWSYDTLAESGEVDYPNINASPALGRQGLAVATAGGDVIWIPYAYYRKEGAAGITREPGDGFAADGASWYWVSPGGRIDKRPLSPNDPPRVIQPGQTLNLRFLLRKNGRTVRAKIQPSTISFTGNGPGGALHFWPLPDHKNINNLSSGKDRLEHSAFLTEQAKSLYYRSTLQADGRTILLSYFSPDLLMPSSSKFTIKVNAGFDAEDGQETSEAEFSVVTSDPSPQTMTARQGFRIVHMAVPEPAIVPSLDQIGIMSTNLPWVVLDASEADGRFFAYALQRFGENEEGQPVGVPNDRVLFYAFNGRMRDGAFLIQSGSCLFEATGFPMPLDTLSFSGRLLPGGEVERGASMMVELKPKGVKQALDALMTMSNVEYMQRLKKAVGTREFNQAFRATVPTVTGYLKNKVWREWGMYNSEGRFVGAGTFRMKALPERELAMPAGVTLKSFTYDLKKGVIVGSAEVAPRSGRAVVLGILVVSEMAGVPDVNLNLALSRQTVNNIQTVTFTAPKGFKLVPGMRADLMADLYPLATLDLK